MTRRRARRAEELDRKAIQVRPDRLGLRDRPVNPDQRATKGSKGNKDLKGRMERASGAMKDRLEFKDRKASMVQSAPVDLKDLKAIPDRPVA